MQNNTIFSSAQWISYKTRTFSTFAHYLLIRTGLAAKVPDPRPQRSNLLHNPTFELWDGILDAQQGSPGRPRLARIGVRRPQIWGPKSRFRTRFGVSGSRDPADPNSEAPISETCIPGSPTWLARSQSETCLRLQDQLGRVWVSGSLTLQIRNRSQITYDPTGSTTYLEIVHR